jgi:hypothetical protein
MTGKEGEVHNGCVNGCNFSKSDNTSGSSKERKGIGH